jgi:alanyl-tRNA synthetase
MTERLYYTDSYLTEFRARVVGVSPDAASPGRQLIYLDRTAFYPTSGGQPFDTGQLGGLQVVEVIDEGDRIAHVVLTSRDREGVVPGFNGHLEATELEGRIHLARRFDHMQQHTGQHLLSAVLLEMFGSPTVGFHLGVESSTIDVAPPGVAQSVAQGAAGALQPEQVREAERRANQVVFENRPVTVSFQHSSQDLGLRKPTEREGEVRIVSIEGLDRSACGGTHVRATGEIGPILLRKPDRIRGNLRIEFLCGGRAVARARADFEALSQIARLFSTPLDEAPAMVEAQREKLQEAEKARQRLAMELAASSGRALFNGAAPGPDGVRRLLRRVESLSEETRAEAQSFTAAGPAIFLAAAENPPSILLAVDPGGGVHAGNVLKATLAAAGGRGGGNAGLAQGSLPSKEALENVIQSLAAQLKFPA